MSTKQIQYGRSGSVGGSIPPGPVSLGMCHLSFPRGFFTDQLSFLFCVSVLLHVPNASITLLSALSAPLSLGRSFLHQLRFRFTFPFFWMYRMRLSLFGPTVARSVFQFHSKKGLLGALVCLHCRSVGLSWICCCCYCWCCCCCFVIVLLLFCCCCSLLLLVVVFWWWYCCRFLMLIINYYFFFLIRNSYIKWVALRPL